MCFTGFVIHFLDDVELLLVHLQVGFEDTGVAKHDLGEVDVRTIAQSRAEKLDFVTGLECRDDGGHGGTPDLSAVDLDRVDNRIRKGNGRGCTQKLAAEICLTKRLLIRKVSDGFRDAS